MTVQVVNGMIFFGSVDRVFQFDNLIKQLDTENSQINICEFNNKLIVTSLVSWDNTHYEIQHDGSLEKSELIA